MSATALLSLAASVGAPLVEKILARRIGGANAALVGRVVEDIAMRAGTTPDQLDARIEAEPETVRDAILDVEEEAPELIAIYARELELRAETMLMEQDEPLWVRAWRPLGMYGLGVLWFWNLIVLHVANAYWKIALPMVDLSVLVQLSALYMSLYMGGHTVKSVMGGWKGRPS